MNRALALSYALVCHLMFAVGGGIMKLNLFFGMQIGLGPRGDWAAAWDLLLIAQFVVGHSWLLTPSGKKALRALAPARAGGVLDTTVFAALSSLQVGLLFGLWAPLPFASYTLPNPAWAACLVAFLVATALVFVAFWEASLGVHLGYAGWLALWRGERPRYPKGFARSGLHGLIRHPIYVGFIAVMWVGPVWSVDKLLIALPLTAYCLLGPRRKEARYAQRYGAPYLEYLRQTPAFIPRLTWGRAAAPAATEARTACPPAMGATPAAP